MISLPSVPSLLLVLGIKMKLATEGTSLEGVFVFLDDFFEKGLLQVLALHAERVMIQESKPQSTPILGMP